MPRNTRFLVLRAQALHSQSQPISSMSGHHGDPGLEGTQRDHQVQPLKLIHIKSETSQPESLALGKGGVESTNSMGAEELHQ